jgi:hypothetical protein
MFVEDVSNIGKDDSVRHENEGVISALLTFSDRNHLPSRLTLPQV